jgi:hypothetical protein
MVGMEGIGINAPMKVLDLFKAHFLEKLASLQAADPMVAIDDNILFAVDLRKFLGKLCEGNVKGVLNLDPGMFPVLPDVQNHKIVTLVDPFLQI